MCVLAPENNMSPLTIENMIAYSQELFQISENTRNILIIVQKKLPKEIPQTEFSKSHILGKIRLFRRTSEKARALQDRQRQDRCSAISRAALNVSCLAGAVLSGVLIPSFEGALGATIGFAIGYVTSGGVNFCLENPERDLSEDGEEVCAGFVAGPCFAIREAAYRVPKRIVRAQSEMTQFQNQIVSDFNGLVTLAQYPENGNPLRKALVDQIGRLQIENDKIAQSETSLNEDKCKVSLYAKTVLEKAASDEKKNLEKGKRNFALHEDALKELDTLVLHIQQRILPNIFQEVIASSVIASDQVSLEEDGSRGLLERGIELPVVSLQMNREVE